MHDNQSVGKITESSSSSSSSSSSDSESDIDDKHKHKVDFSGGQGEIIQTWNKKSAGVDNVIIKSNLVGSNLVKSREINDKVIATSKDMDVIPSQLDDGAILVTPAVEQKIISAIPEDIEVVTHKNVKTHVVKTEESTTSLAEVKTEANDGIDGEFTPSMSSKPEVTDTSERSSEPKITNNSGNGSMETLEGTTSSDICSETASETANIAAETSQVKEAAATEPPAETTMDRTDEIESTGSNAAQGTLEMEFVATTTDNIEGNHTGAANDLHTEPEIIPESAKEGTVNYLI